MSRKFSLLTAAALALSLLTGPATAQVTGGVLKFATPSVKPGLDPARTSTGDGYMLTAMIFSNLTRVSHELKAEPQLAHTWEANEDSSEWTFHLVKNAKFTNGRPVTAHDVKFSFERILDPETASRGRKAMGPIETITVKDDHTLVITLKGPYADLPLQLGNTFARVIAEENLEEISHNPVGSGPFILKEYIPGNKAILVRNPDYFEEGLPYLGEVHQIYIKEYAAQVSALTTGEIDIMYFAPSEIIPQLEADPNVDVRITPAPSFQPLVMFVEQSPFNDVRVRQALRFALESRSHARSRNRGPGLARQRHPRRPGQPVLQQGPAPAHARRGEGEAAPGRGWLPQRPGRHAVHFHRPAGARAGGRRRPAEPDGGGLQREHRERRDCQAVQGHPAQSGGRADVAQPTGSAGRPSTRRSRRSSPPAPTGTTPSTPIRRSTSF